LFLKRCADEAGLLFGGAFQGETQAHAVLFARKTRSVENLLGASGSVRMLRDIRIGGPVIRGQRARGELRLAMEEIADERFAVGRKCKGLANISMGQERIFEIETEISEIRAGTVGQCKIGLARENGNNIWRKGTHLQIGRAFAQFERANDAVGDDAKSDARDLRRITEVFGIALHDNLFVLRLSNEAKRAGADGVAGKIGAGICRNDANGARNKIHAEGSVRLSKMKDDRGGVGRFDGGDHAKGALFRGFIGGIHDEVESRLDVGGGERAAVVEANAAAKMENVRERIRSRPGFRKIAVKIHLIVALQQAAEEEPIDALGLRIRGKARIEVGGAGFDEEGKRRRIGVIVAGTAGERKRKNTEKELTQRSQKRRDRREEKNGEIHEEAKIR
jgi:hypothetical protein